MRFQLALELRTKPGRNKKRRGMLLGSYFRGMVIAAPLFLFNPEGSSFRLAPESVKLS